MRRVYPGVPAAPRLRRDEPRPPRRRALGLLPPPRAGRRRQRGCAPPLLRRVQRGARHAGRVLPRHDRTGCSRSIALPQGPMFEVRGEPVRPEAIAKTALLTIEGELDDISGNGQTEAAHALCTGIPREAAQHYLVARRRPLRHLQRPALARGDRAAHPRLHPPARLGPSRPATATGRAARCSRSAAVAALGAALCRLAGARHDARASCSARSTCGGSRSSAATRPTAR